MFWVCSLFKVPSWEEKKKKKQEILSMYEEGQANINTQLHPVAIEMFSLSCFKLINKQFQIGLPA